MLESDVYKKSQDRFCNNAIYSSDRTKTQQILMFANLHVFFENSVSDTRKHAGDQMEQKKDMKKGVEISISTPWMMADGM